MRNRSILSFALALAQIRSILSFKLALAQIRLALAQIRLPDCHADLFLSSSQHGRFGVVIPIYQNDDMQ